MAIANLSRTPTDRMETRFQADNHRSYSTPGGTAIASNFNPCYSLTWTSSLVICANYNGLVTRWSSKLTGPSIMYALKRTVNIFLYNRHLHISDHDTNTLDHSPKLIKQKHISCLRIPTLYL